MDTEIRMAQEPPSQPPSHKAMPRPTQRVRKLFAAILCVVTALTSIATITPNAEASSALAANLARDSNSKWQVEGTVNAVLAVGNTLYIGGDFSALYTDAGSRRERNNLAAISLATGEPTTFNPNLNDKVFALVASGDGSTLYVGGAFTKSGGADRKRLAAYTTSNGRLTNFNPAPPNSALRALALRGDRLFVGGLFQRIGNVNRSYVAAYRLSSATLDTNWKPVANDRVMSIVADSSRVWIGGDFSRINNSPAPNLAAVTPGDGTLLSTDHPNYPVIALAAKDNRLYVAGGGPGGRAAAYNRSSGSEIWTISSDGNFQAVSVGVDYVYFGGHYENVEGTPVGRVTRHNMSNGALDPSWLPLVNGLRSINALAATASTVSIGGDFTFVARERHRGVAVFRRSSGSVPSPTPTPAPTPRPTPAPTPRPAPTPTPPAGDDLKLVALTMHDYNKNGRIDAVRARYNRALGQCTGSCTGGWNLTNAPSGARLESVTISDRTATLRLTEGTGDADTAAAAFRVAFRPAAAVAASAAFPPTAPVDMAAPIAMHIRKTNAGTPGRAQRGDTFSVIWSEPLDPASVPSSTPVRLMDPGNRTNDRLYIENIIAGYASLGSSGYVVCSSAHCSTEQHARFPDSRVTLTGRNLTITLATCSGACDRLAAGPEVSFTYKASTGLRDKAGNSAVDTPVTKTLRLF